MIGNTSHGIHKIFFLTAFEWIKWAFCLIQFEQKSCSCSYDWNFFRGFLETTADNLWEVELNITTLDKTEILIYKYFKILRSFVLMWAKKISSLGLVWLWVVPLCVIMMVQKIILTRASFWFIMLYHPFWRPKSRGKKFSPLPPLFLVLFHCQNLPLRKQENYAKCSILKLRKLKAIKQPWKLVLDPFGNKEYIRAHVLRILS